MSQYPPEGSVTNLGNLRTKRRDPVIDLQARRLGSVSLETVLVQSDDATPQLLGFLL